MVQVGALHSIVTANLQFFTFACTFRPRRWSRFSEQMLETYSKPTELDGLLSNFFCNILNLFVVHAYNMHKALFLSSSSLTIR